MTREELKHRERWLEAELLNRRAEIKAMLASIEMMNVGLRKAIEELGQVRGELLLREEGKR